MDENTEVNDEVTDEVVDEAAPEGNEQEQETEQELTPGDTALRLASLEAVVSAYLPEGTDIERELGYVAGLSLDDKGNVVGEARYRPVAKQATTSPRRRTTAAAKPQSRDRETEIDDFITKTIERVNNAAAGQV